MARALEGLRICDFTGQLAGAGATKWLASFGAEVIRIEDPVREGRWDILRGGEPYKDDRRGIDMGGAFNNHNTDKLGITLNLRTDKGKSLLTDIVRKSDAVTENFAAGVLEKWGFGYEQLCAIKPDIVYVSNCGFGHVGPYSAFKTWGPIVQAVSGLTHTSALAGEEPAGWGYSYMDHTGGYYMVMAIMLALLHRQRTGEGQWVDLACTESALSLHGPALLDWSANGVGTRNAAGLNSNRAQHQAMAPHGIYPCQGEDEWIAIACRTDDDWERLTELIATDGTQQWCRAPNYRELSGRIADQDAIDSLLADWTQNYRKSELAQRLQALPIPVSPVQKPAERIDGDPNTQNFGLWPSVTHSKMGDVRVDGQPVNMSATNWQMQSGAPCLGEHNEQVFCGLLGLSRAELAQLEEEGVV